MNPTWNYLKKVMIKKMGLEIQLTELASHNLWNDVTATVPLIEANFGSVTLVNGIRHTEGKRVTPVIDGLVDSTWQYDNSLRVDQFTEGTEGATGTGYTMWDSEFLYVLIGSLKP